MLKLEKKYLGEFDIAREFLKVAKDNLRVSLRTSANRLYFSFEKAVVAYLMFKGEKIPRNHQGVWELCSEFLGEEFYGHLRYLYDLRMQADYGAVSVFVEFSEKVVEEGIKTAEILIGKIGGLLDG